jgi:hypothetical protein
MVHRRDPTERVPSNQQQPVDKPRPIFVLKFQKLDLTSKIHI